MFMMPTKLTILLFFVFVGSAFAAVELPFTVGAMTGVAWLPEGWEAKEEKLPLVIFSHGWAGSARQSVFLCQAIADAGYFVAAPNHADAVVGRTPSEIVMDKRLQGGALIRRLKNSFENQSGEGEGVQDAAFPKFFDYEEWTDATQRNRADDVGMTLLWATKDAPWASKVDAAKVGLVGHSLGGYTVLGLVGGWPSWMDECYQCVLALAPYTNPYIFNRSLGAVRVPVMIQVGTLDPGIFPYVTDTEGTYAQLGGKKYLLTLLAGTHYSFTDAGVLQHEVIVKYALAFLDENLKGKAAEPLLREAGTDQAGLEWKLPETTKVPEAPVAE